MRGRIERVLDWASVNGFRDGNVPNPARWRGHLEHSFAPRSKLQTVKHLPALPYTELFAFMSGLKREEGLAARALELCIFTVARTSQVLRAVWGEFDLDKRVWIIPGDRMKAKREHRVPLPEAAMEILRPLHAVRSDDNAYVFPGKRPNKPLVEHAMTRVLHGLGRTDVTTHGFRSTFSTWAAETTDAPAELRELALAHAVSDKVIAAYQRSDMFKKRLCLAEQWARYCTSPPSTTAEIFALPAA